MEYQFNVRKVTHAILRANCTSWKINRIHSKDEYTFAYVLDGEMIYTFPSNEKLVLKKDDMCLFPPGMTRTMQGGFDTPLSYISISFTMIFYDENEESFRKLLFLTRGEYDYIKHDAKELVNAWNFKKDYFNFKCSIYMSNILYKLLILKKNSHNGYYSRNLHNALDYIHEHFTEELSLDTLSEISGLSKSYFRKLFLDKYSVSPLQYVLNLRLNKASELLKTGLFSVSEVSVLSGFNDVSYFSKYYKKKTGKSPKSMMQKDEDVNTL